VGALNDVIGMRPPVSYSVCFGASWSVGGRVARTLVWSCWSFRHYYFGLFLSLL